MIKTAEGLSTFLSEYKMKYDFSEIGNTQMSWVAEFESKPFVANVGVHQLSINFLILTQYGLLLEAIPF